MLSLQCADGDDVTCLMMGAIVIEDRAAVRFLFFPTGEIELSHMGKNRGNS